MNILLGENRTPVRMKVVELLRAIPDIEKYDEARDYEELLIKASSEKYDIIITDSTMNGLSGMDFLRRMRRNKNKTHVLLYGDFMQKQHPIQALRYGASGFLSTSCMLQELTLAIRRIMHGELYVSAESA